MSDDAAVHGGEPRGIGVEDLPAIMRELFDQCVTDARSVVDPGDDFDGFLEVLWEQLAGTFGLVRQDWPADAPRPWPVLVEDQRGYAQAILEGRPPGDG
jgi:hypothetical protein